MRADARRDSLRAAALVPLEGSALRAVEATVGGHAARLLVDTAAPDDFISSALVASSALPVVRSSDDAPVDPGGRTFAATRLLRPGLTLVGWGAVPEVPVLVASLPDLGRRGLAGVLSPQRLAREGEAVLLDLPRNRLTIGSFDALAAPGAQGLSLAPTPVRPCEVGNGGRTYVVAATVDGRPVQLALATGAERTTLYASAPALASLAGSPLPAASTPPAPPASSAASPLGSANSLRLGPTSVALVVGEWSGRVAVDVVPGASLRPGACPRDGLLGIDVLRSCVLVLGDARATGRCRAAPDAR